MVTAQAIEPVLPYFNKIIEESSDGFQPLYNRNDNGFQKQGSTGSIACAVTTMHSLKRLCYLGHCKNVEIR